jgi:hypothetical protein
VSTRPLSLLAIPTTADLTSYESPHEITCGELTVPPSNNSSISTTKPSNRHLLLVSISFVVDGAHLTIALGQSLDRRRTSREA